MSRSILRIEAVKLLLVALVVVPVSLFLFQSGAFGNDSKKVLKLNEVDAMLKGNNGDNKGLISVSKLLAEDYQSLRTSEETISDEIELLYSKKCAEIAAEMNSKSDQSDYKDSDVDQRTNKMARASAKNSAMSDAMEKARKEIEKSVTGKYSKDISVIKSDIAVMEKANPILTQKVRRFAILPTQYFVWEYLSDDSKSLDVKAEVLAKALVESGAYAALENETPDIYTPPTTRRPIIPIENEPVQ